MENAGLLRIDQGKGGKDRYVSLPPTLLKHLRDYWHVEKPVRWLFPNEQHPDEALSISTPQKVFRRAKQPGGHHQGGWHPQLETRLCYPSTAGGHGGAAVAVSTGPPQHPIDLALCPLGVSMIARAIAVAPI